MQLVILAAGYGRRFGGLKQLAPTGPNGEAIIDYTASDALDSGYEEAILIVREEIEEEVLAHIERCWPKGLLATLVRQIPVAGTAGAILSAAPAVTGPFGVVNADDYYGPAALGVLHRALRARELGEASGHVAVGYHLRETVLTGEPVTRGICTTTDDGRLTSIVEHVVEKDPAGRFLAHRLGADDERVELSGNELVSMNLWGFTPRIFAELEQAARAFDPAKAGRAELIVVDVVNEAVSSGRDRVEVIETTDRCIGITHSEDVAIVRDELAGVPSPRH